MIYKNNVIIVLQRLGCPINQGWGNMPFKVKICEHYIPFFLSVNIIICHFLIFIMTQKYIFKLIILIFEGYI